MDNIRNRSWRRKQTQSVWNRRCKKFMFQGLIENGSKVVTCTTLDGKKIQFTRRMWRKPSTWKDFKENDPWAKYLKDGNPYHRFVSDKEDAKHKIKLQRINNKKLIIEGIQEWDDIYDETLEDFFYINLV